MSAALTIHKEKNLFVVLNKFKAISFSICSLNLYTKKSRMRRVNGGSERAFSALKSNLFAKENMMK